MKIGYGIGRRKTAIAQVILKVGKGKLIINEKDGNLYLQNNPTYLQKLNNPFSLLGLNSNFDIYIKTYGGGLTGQTDAIVLGIARALTTIDFQNRLISPGPDGFVTPGNFATGFSIIELASTDAGDTVSKIEFKVNNLSTPVATYFENEISMFDINITDNILSTTVTDGDLVITGNGEGVVKILSPLSLPKISDPDQPADGTTIYAKAEADGGTGIFFITENGTQDELISRNKSLLYSIIF